MAILKHITEGGNFLHVSKRYLQDENFSLIERGFLTTLLALPDNWDYTDEGMSRIIPDGKDRIRAARKSLVKKGYIIMHKKRNSEGRYCGIDMEVFDNLLLKNPSAEKP